MNSNNEFQGYSQDANFQDPLMNPSMQYEQAYMYYRYLTQTMEYKIRCKEYEKLCKNEGLGA